MKTTLLILSVCLVFAFWVSPVQAGSEQNDLCSDTIDNDGDGDIDCADYDCRQECAGGGGDPGSGEGFSAEGAVGRELGCLACEDIGCGVGDFFDRGVVDGVGSACVNLTCGSGNGQNLVCGRQSDPQPRIDIEGLHPIWNADPDSQGDPEVCFGEDGLVEAKVHTENSGSGNQIHVYLFFASGVDASVAPARCDGSEIVRYVVEVDTCTLSDPTSNYPPLPGETTIVTCPGGAPVAIHTEGGGRPAKKCGCEATGVIATLTDLTFLGQ